MADAAENVLFSREYEAELDDWLQRRFGYLCITFAVIEFLFAAWSVFLLTVRVQNPMADTAADWVGLTLSIAGLAVVSAFLVRRMRRAETRPTLLRATTWLILALGGLALAEALVIHWLGGRDQISVLGRLFLWHLTACIILPWHPRESLRPMVPLLILWAVEVFAFSQGAEFWARAGTAPFAPVILLPGLAICALRMSMHGRRFQTQMIGRHFRSLRREMSQARALHEALFPKPHADGHVRFEYSYVPAADVGGDFIHLSVGPTGVIAATLIDVTGHGIAAALTVNRLFGELERIRAERPRIEPADLLCLLNRYVSLTLARHGVFATAVCLEVDPYVGELRFANGGHPPLIVRRADGAVETLEVDGMILGAVGDDGFECKPMVVKLAPGDVVLAYTDGVFEAFNRRGEQFGMARFLEALTRHPAPPSWPSFLGGLVERHHGGRSQDDLLIAALIFEKTREQAREQSRATSGRAQGPASVGPAVPALGRS